MPYVTTGQENSGPIEIYYEDHGAGTPVVLIHGFPLDCHSWEKQVPPLLEAGHRVIAYDRRGFGRSSQPTTGYDYDTFAADLNTLMERLDLRDVVLVGFSMGTGEVTRYLGTHGSGRVRKAVLLAPLQPYLVDERGGIDPSVLDGIQKSIAADRYAYLKTFLDDFYNVDVLSGERISEEAWQASWNVAAAASAKGTYDCVPTWGTDFRGDLPKIDVPVLVMQGDEDRILPIDSTGKRLGGLIKDLRFEVVEGGPHNIGWTHPEQVNRTLVEFAR
ncbi:alpha/beta hydrolase [Nonomuraea sp. NPDC048916]|uniref:alpha/beta fold hydrolase n=1 Tax=Nonomuraea sp. NPDC048916 TaxID=3154232 RepID=UPI0033F184D7